MHRLFACHLAVVSEWGHALLICFSPSSCSEPGHALIGLFIGLNHVMVLKSMKWWPFKTKLLSQIYRAEDSTMHCNHLDQTESSPPFGSNYWIHLDRRHGTQWHHVVPLRCTDMNDEFSNKLLSWVRFSSASLLEYRFGDSSSRLSRHWSCFGQAKASRY